MLHPDVLIASYGLIGLAVVIFAETGLLVGVVLPGETMLVLAGAFTNPVHGVRTLTMPAVIATAALAATAGGLTGYAIGRRSGLVFVHRPDGRIYRRSYLTRTERFFTRHGPRAVVLARFVPVVRTFAAPAAGVGRMPGRRFAVYNAIGAVVWATVATVAGHTVAEYVPVNHYLLPLTLGIGLLSLTPAVVGWAHARRTSRGV